MTQKTNDFCPWEKFYRKNLPLPQIWQRSHKGISNHNSSQYLLVKYQHPSLSHSKRHIEHQLIWAAGPPHRETRPQYLAWKQWTHVPLQKGTFLREEDRAETNMTSSSSKIYKWDESIHLPRVEQIKGLIEFSPQDVKKRPQWEKSTLPKYSPFQRWSFSTY